MKQSHTFRATISWVYLAVAAVLPVVPVPAMSQAQDASAYRLPLFRHVEAGTKPPQLAANETVRRLADGDFPPFSFPSGVSLMA